MKKLLLAATAASLSLGVSGCNDAPLSSEESETPVATETPTALSEEEKQAYRDQLEAADMKSIARLTMAAPSPELRAEAEARREELMNSE